MSGCAGSPLVRQFGGYEKGCRVVLCHFLAKKSFCSLEIRSTVVVSLSSSFEVKWCLVMEPLDLKANGTAGVTK